MSNAASKDRIVGRLRSADAKGVVQIEARFGNGIADVWTAFTDPSRLERWLGRFEGDLRPGGIFRAHFFASDWNGSGRVTTCEPYQRIAVVTREDDGSDEHVIDVTFAVDGDATSDASDGTSDGTLVVVEERGMPLEQLAAYGAGVQVHVEDLAAHLAGAERCDAVKRWTELFPSYQRLLSG